MEVSDDGSGEGVYASVHTSDVHTSIVNESADVAVKHKSPVKKSKRSYRSTQQDFNEINL